MAAPGDARSGPGAGSLGGRAGALVVVPARLAATRLPRKMLLRETGHYLFEHTVRNAERCPAVERAVLATDSEEIAAAAREVGIEPVPTSPEHPSGTDRVEEAHRILLERGEGPWEVVVDVQGDEPELPSEHLRRLVEAFADPAVRLATLCAPLEDPSGADDPSVVKVVRDAAGDALYFSRAPIPSPARGAGVGAMRRHVGAYAFRPDALAEFCALPPGTLERAESLEQLRWLEAGRRLRVVEVDRATGGIDTPAQYADFVARATSEATRPLARTTSPPSASRP